MGDDRPCLYFHDLGLVIRLLLLANQIVAFWKWANHRLTSSINLKIGLKQNYSWCMTIKFQWSVMVFYLALTIPQLPLPPPPPKQPPPRQFGKSRFWLAGLATGFEPSFPPVSSSLGSSLGHQTGANTLWQTFDIYYRNRKYFRLKKARLTFPFWEMNIGQFIGHYLHCVK